MKRNLVKIVTLCAAVALCLSAVLCFSLTASAATTTIFDEDVTATVTFAQADKGVYVNAAAADTALQNDYAANGAGVYTVAITGTIDVNATMYPCIIDAEGSDIWPGGAYNYSLTAGTEGTIYGDIAFTTVAPKKIWVYIEEVTGTWNVTHIKVEVTRDGEASEEPATSEASEEPTTSEDPATSEASEEPVISEEPTTSEVSEEPTTSEVSEEPTTSETSEEPTEVKHGDATGDGEIDMKDVLAIRKFIAGMESDINEAAADAYRDGEIDMKDVLVIRKFIANMIDELPVYPEVEPTSDVEASDVEASDVEASEAEASEVEASEVEASETEASEVEASEAEASEEL